ncbi:1,2-phenylacetyl-CoA epoxidase subunit PaaE [Phaeodactylibacter luteus]|uniref:Phenylacetate-CoA oxygenase/reductase subunit PaaK n=1 Tax=Phaeodactylibacter luteus TaxID=1564516 RepID=A0A5C6RZQ9_9BACT|nr:1,2-phenylacetyl-CoA epoxidase subunit PaaE [Phaeodactylibacter luteus]TXB67587.1 phenylacetate-CoA oxygenase/reductase subunit PaaK [Phaeodactylibacter luteus]
MPKFHNLKVKDVRRETEECVSVAFDLPPGLREAYEYLPGQYLTLKAEIGGEEVRRSYSICSSPSDGELRVAVKKVPGGRFSTFANEQLKHGDTLEVMTPMGRFHNQPNPANAKQYVAFAAGSGITPVRAILKAVLEEEPRSTFTLFYGNRGVDSIIFREDIEGLKNEYMGRLRIFHVLSREKLGSPLFTGRITGEKAGLLCDKLIDLSQVDEFFLCGPQAMTDAITEVLKSKGVDRKKIHFELFTTGKAQLPPQPKVQEKQADVEAKVTIVLDGNAMEFPLSSNAENILDGALKAGADLPYACKGGVCSTCRAKVTAGEVYMDVNYALEPEEVEAGYVLTCQAHPKTDEVTVDFDA